MTNINSPAPPDQPTQPGYPYPPEGPQPPRGKRHWIRNTLIAAGGVAIVIGTAAALSNSGSQHPAAGTPSTFASQPAPQVTTDVPATAAPVPSGPDMLAMGQAETIASNDTNATEGTVTVSSPYRTTRPQMDYGSAPAHGWFVIVTVTYAADPGYTGGFSYNPLDFYALARGYHYSWDSGNAVEAIDSSQMLDSGTLGAGETASGKIAFDVPSPHGQIVYAPNLDGQPLAEWSY